MTHYVLQTRHYNTTYSSLVGKWRGLVKPVIIGTLLPTQIEENHILHI